MRQLKLLPSDVAIDNKIDATSVSLLERPTHCVWYVFQRGKAREEDVQFGPGQDSLAQLVRLEVVGVLVHTCQSTGITMCCDCSEHQVNKNHKTDVTYKFKTTPVCKKH